jgi:hypothetical protein
LVVGDGVNLPIVQGVGSRQQGAGSREAEKRRSREAGEKGRIILLVLKICQF